MTVENAARVTDDIVHGDTGRDSYLASIIFGVGGAVIGAVVVVGTGGTGAVVMAALAGAGWGKFLGDLVDKYALSGGGEDKIDGGAATVFTNLEQAAKAHPDTTLDHRPHFVRTGAEHVSIENANAGRVKDLTTCPGVVVSGSPDTHIGGASVEVAPAAPDPEPLWFTIWDKGMALAGIATASPNTGREAACLAYDVGSFVVPVPDEYGGLKDAADIGAMVICNAIPSGAPSN